MQSSSAPIAVSPLIKASWAISRRPVSGLLRCLSARKLDAVGFGNIVIIRTTRPMVNVGSRVAPHWPVVFFAASDAMVALIEAQRALGPVSKILRLNGVRVSP